MLGPVRLLCDNVSRKTNILKSYLAMHFARMKCTILKRRAYSGFHKAYYYSNVWQNTFWVGHNVYKTPLDMWVFQEILYDVKPDIIIECGTNRGGSALFMAHVCDIVGRGKIITIDIRQIANRPIHPRVEYLCGSTTSEETITRIKKKF